MIEWTPTEITKVGGRLMASTKLLHDGKPVFMGGVASLGAPIVMVARIGTDERDLLATVEAGKTRYA